VQQVELRPRHRTQRRRQHQQARLASAIAAEAQLLHVWRGARAQERGQHDERSLA